MEKEIERLRRNISQAKSQGYAMDEDEDLQSQLQSPVANSVYSHTRNPSLMGSDEAVTSLLTLVSALLDLAPVETSRPSSN